MADCVTNQKISLKSVDYQIENIISEIFGFTTDERNFLNTFANSLRKKGWFTFCVICSRKVKL